MAEAADPCGYDMIGIADTPGIAMDPWVATTILAENVRRARVAVCVTNLVTRHPAIAAASLASGGAGADGVFINYGLAADNVVQSEGTVVRAARTAGRNPDEVEIWQIACLDCGLDGDASRRKIGAILAFVSAYVMGGGDLARRGVPAEHRAALLELRRRYSPRPGEADAALVTELGLFDYLSRRLAICGTPEECLAQVRAAQAAGVRR